jgi:uncharacterized membrane protein
MARLSRLGIGTDRSDLSVPRGAAPRGSLYDADAFGRFSEALARTLGTGRYLFAQTVFVIGWIILNVVAGARHWDPYPFILLNLAFSTQAAYAAPLILLAQNRQADRDKVQNEQDRSRDEQNIANTEYLLREVASLRLAVNDVATRDFVRSELQALFKDLELSRVEER